MNEKDDRIILCNEYKQGAGAARNRGVAISRGDYITFFDVDDTYSNNKISVLYNVLKKHNSAEMVFGKIIAKYPINFITCINSIANGLVIDTVKECPVIYPKSGFGGIGGNIVKPTALANVRQFYNLLSPKMSVIGCGGVLTGEDAFHHLLAGASAVSVGTSLMVILQKSSFWKF